MGLGDEDKPLAHVTDLKKDISKSPSILFQRGKSALPVLKEQDEGIVCNNNSA